MTVSNNSEILKLGKKYLKEFRKKFKERYKLSYAKDFSFKYIHFSMDLTLTDTE